ncbi:microcystin-dependent protein [Fontibacillus solani]|uniref:Microcystin-dependent protein n=1 Tax=Fontibacillus solani TaxID=1572857 RepID=A0A7W3XQ83_9BACL|nr:tail fiber protein [Fontibacillus solani]MBA9084185.1 microcystin-dependent protein [Fontibacillus solani]
MSEAYVGEIRMFAGNYAPQGWALCNGQILSIAENEVLFMLLGTTYGGDGQTTFALPDLQGRIPIHRSTNYALGAKDGTETVTLTTNQLPAHTHLAHTSSATGDTASPANMIWANTAANTFAASGTTVPMNLSSLSSTGNNMPHDNLMPSTTISFIISLYGIFPQQS